MRAAHSSHTYEPIAIIGLAGRFPGAPTLAEFWRNLRAGVDSMATFTDDELQASGVSPERYRDAAYVRRRGVLDGEDLFDASFFQMSPREAELTDPQHRLALECAWEALEHAGYDPERYAGRIGVFAGSSPNTYLLNNLLPNRELMRAAGATKISTQNRVDHLATRLAYKLNLRGPAITVQCACSTSLVATHLACRSLHARECDLAIALGVSLMPPQRCGYVYQPGGPQSSDGRCRAFDAKADGMASGSGIGVVVLKRASAAAADGDAVHAIVRGSAVNNDGSTKAGYTAPSMQGQAEVIAEALAASGVPADSISHVEAHGTGTPLGDPIEIAALTHAFRQHTDRSGFCAVGSVKTNVGHLDAAAGVAGLIKTVLALEGGELPPSLYFETPNPEIQFDRTPFYVNVARTPWPRGERPRRAGVSAFGFGGTNAHVILEESPPPIAGRETDGWQLLPLSGRTPAALEQATANLAAHLAEHDVPLVDVAYTLQAGRTEFAHRRAVVARSSEDAIRSLQTLDPTRVVTSMEEAAGRETAWIFPGQGAQHVNMGRGLYEREAVFRETFDECCGVLDPLLGRSLREIVYPSAGAEAAGEALLTETALAQPALFAVEYALARLWQSWGCRPAAMVGHSLGEYVAACVADVFAPADALRLVAERGRLLQELTPGGMLSVGAPPERVRALVGGDVDVAAVNHASLCVIAGTLDAIAASETVLRRAGVTCQRLRTSHAFHSRMVDPILERFADVVRAVPVRPPSRPLLSTLTGTWMTRDGVLDPDYWVRHLREPVQFGKALEELLRRPEWALLEVGPGRTATVIARLHPQRLARQPLVQSLGPRESRDPDQAWILMALGRLWLSGVAIDWTPLTERGAPRRVPLPTYPFERRRFWIDESRRPAPGTAAADGGTSLFYVPAWEPSLSGAATLPRGRAVVFVDTDWASRLAAGFAERGNDVIVVEPGERFTWREKRVRLRPDEPGDYRELLDRLRDLDPSPLTFVFLWRLTTPDEDEGGHAADFMSLMHLGQAIGQSPLAEPLRVVVVSSGAFAVSGRERLEPRHALLLGPTLVMPQEDARLQCRYIDVDLESGAAESELRLLADEILSDGAPAVVALRDGVRWVQRFRPLMLDSARERAPLRDRGVYLITGGFGGIGGAAARHLAEAVRARLVLVGRTALPPRSEWPRIGPGDRGCQRVQQVLALEAMGAEVETISADVCDAGAMRAGLVRATARFGPLHGVIHAAGVPGGGMLQLRTATSVAQVLAPKVRGVSTLDALTRDYALDFFLLCSSRAAILGGVGQADYAAANAFLDAFAHARRRAGVRMTAVDWDAWQQVGMRVDAARRLALLDAPPEGEPWTHPLIQRRIVDADGRQRFIGSVSVRSHWVVDDHRIVGKAVMPGTAYLEMARAAVAPQHPGAAIDLADVYFLTPLGVRDDETKTFELVLEPDGEGEYSFRVSSQEAGAPGPPLEHVMGRVRIVTPAADEFIDLGGPTPALVPEADARMTGREHDEDLGPRWQSFERVTRGERSAVVRLELPREFDEDFTAFALHPGLLDRATGSAMDYIVGPGPYLPLSYKRLSIRHPLTRCVFSHSRLKDTEFSSGETITFDIQVTDESGRVLLVIEEFAQKRINLIASHLRNFMGGESRPLPAPAPQNAVADELARGLTPEQGVAALHTALTRAAALPQLVVSLEHLPAVLDRVHNRYAIAAAEKLLDRRPALPAHPRPALSSAFTPPRDDLERQLAGIWTEVLGVSEVGVHDSFFDFGGDSVHAIQVIAKAHRLGIEITPQQLFEYQTIAELAPAVAPSGAPVATAARAGDAAAAARPFALAKLSDAELARVAERLEEPAAGTPEHRTAIAVRDHDYEELLRKHPLVAQAPMARGADGAIRIVVPPDAERRALPPLEFSLFYFADARTAGTDDKYRLLLEGARFADAHGFTAVWTPERHFHHQGGLYPSPSLLSAALATITSRVRLRAGSVVLPLHQTLRVAEEWAVVDNLSRGRVGVSFTSGWLPNDFALAPGRFGRKREEMFAAIAQVQRLWRGDTIRLPNGVGQEVDVRVYPRPVQAELPVWLTCTSDPAMFEAAGRLGFEVLTGLLAQSLEQAAPKISAYEEALGRHGFARRDRRVTMMLHTFVGADADAVLASVRQPLFAYLKSHVSLREMLVENFKLELGVDAARYRDDLVNFAVERYIRTASLIGTPDACVPMLERLRALGVDELACLIDFGVDVDATLASLEHLSALKARHERDVAAAARLVPPPRDYLRSITGNPDAPDVVCAESLHESDRRMSESHVG